MELSIYMNGYVAVQTNIFVPYGDELEIVPATWLQPESGGWNYDEGECCRMGKPAHRGYGMVGVTALKLFQNKSEALVWGVANNARTFRDRWGRIAPINGER